MPWRKSKQAPVHTNAIEAVLTCDALWVLHT